MVEAVQQPPAPPKPFRLAALFCLLGGGALVVAFFLPFVHVEQEGAQQFAEAVRRDLGPDLAENTPESDFVDVFAKVADAEAVRTVDLLHYIRAVEGLDGPPEASPGAQSSPQGSTHGSTQSVSRRTTPLERARFLLLLLIVTVPVAGGVLAAYALGWRFKRLGAPVLALTFPTGLLGLAMPLVFAWYAPAQSEAVRPLLGAWVQLGGAVVLLLVGLFGVTRRTWLYAWLGGIVLTAGVGLATWIYLVREAAA